MMTWRLPSQLFLLPLIFLSLPLDAQPGGPRKVTLSVAAGTAPEAALSGGFTLSEISFDESASMSDPERRSASGILLASHTPRTIWHGERPGFAPPRRMIAGSGDLLPLTDVIESGDFLCLHYGKDHYQTKIVVVIDVNRHEVLEIDTGAAGNISRLYCDPATETIYYTTVEGNIGEAERARLHAYSVRESKPLWSTDTATAQGDFLVFGKHILCHYGFTAQDDFINVIDKGSGKVLKKHRIATAASNLIPEGEGILVPCYRGIYEIAFSEG